MANYGSQPKIRHVNMADSIEAYGRSKAYMCACVCIIQEIKLQTSREQRSKEKTLRVGWVREKQEQVWGSWRQADTGDHRPQRSPSSVTIIARWLLEVGGEVTGCLRHVLECSREERSCLCSRVFRRVVSFFNVPSPRLGRVFRFFLNFGPVLTRFLGFLKFKTRLRQVRTQNTQNLSFLFPPYQIYTAQLCSIVFVFIDCH